MGFCQRRFLRIFPPYWASLGLVLGVITLRLATQGVNDVAVLPKDVASVLHTVLAAVQPATSTPGINWVYWSLVYELAFYLVLGALGGRGAWLLLPLFSAIAAVSPGFPFSHWGLFGLGVAVHQATQGARARAGVLAALCLTGNMIHLEATANLVGVVTALLIGFPPALASHQALRPLRTVGTYSYSLFLVHVPVGCYLVPHYLPWKFSREIGPSLLQDALLLTCSLVVAYAFYHLIERPSHAWARKITRPTPPPPPTPRQVSPQTATAGCANA